MDGQPPEKWQPLDEHLKQVAERSAEYADAFKSADWAFNAGWLHDLGKATSAFQGYLLRENGLDDSEYDNGRINHSTAGAIVASEKLGKYVGRILAYIVAGHHAGLPNYNDGTRASLLYRIQNDRGVLEQLDVYIEKTVNCINVLKRPPDFIKSEKGYHFWIRFLFSCLVDADYLDTEEFICQGTKAQRDGYKTIGFLKVLFDEHINNMIAGSKETDVNSVRKEVLNNCRQAAESKPGLFSLTVPTGGGKTLSSVAFALDHILYNNKNDKGLKKKRIIYVIPYTSIIEQTAKVLADIFGADNVVEHHSNLDPEKETERSRMASENWDAPIIVTTNVQFFESLFAAKPSRCRKLHNIVNSVVILDEAQLLPEKWLTPCVEAINQLATNYGATILLSTATQPALPGLMKPTEIIEGVQVIYDRLKRTEINLPVDMDVLVSWEEMARKLQKHEQVLCILNTKRDCRELFALMPKGTVHLSTWMCGEHRSKVIAEIKTKLEQKQPIRVISTQLVEAGVDIDFPAVYRAFAGLSSIAQAAGRCNREGKLEKGEVHVFIPQGSKLPDMLRKGSQTMRAFCHNPGLDLNNSSLYPKYFESYYGSLNDTGKEWLNDLLVRDVNPDLSFQFRTTGEQFKLIEEQNQRPVFVRFGESEKWLEQLGKFGPFRVVLRKLQRYTVNLYKPAFDGAYRKGLINEIWPGFYVWNGKYNDVIGIDLEGGWTPEDMTI
jgi:CRISPR-associated endonuclease/helicase Cas3